MPYLNKVSNENVPQTQLPVGRIVSKYFDLPVVEAPLTEETLARECFVEMDEQKVILLNATSYLWTNSLATCHAICMYGWPPREELGHLAFAHVSDVWTVKGALKELHDELKTYGPDVLQTFIIGGQPASSYGIEELGGDLWDLYKIRGIVEPLTEDDKGDAMVVATCCGVGFRVFTD